MPAKRPIDFRSDTITQPTRAMRIAMRDAVVGDDAFGEDPTVNELEAKSARRVGHEAAVFMPSGTMVNQSAILVHSGRRGEILCEADAHLLHYEAGAPALLSGVMIRTLPGEGGVFTADQVRRALRPSDPHFPSTTLVAIENTHNRAGGTVWTTRQTEDVVKAAHEHDIPVHLDGARIFNSAVAQDVPVRRLTRMVDSVGFCFSKGLSAPVGSVLCGDHEFIEEARRVRKILGGGMRQAGVLAAAGLIALDTMVERLKDDHANARRLARSLSEVPGIEIDLEGVQTNIVLIRVAGTGWSASDFCTAAGQAGVRCLPFEDGSTVRFVTNRHVTRADVDEAADIVTRMLAGSRRRRPRQSGTKK